MSDVYMKSMYPWSVTWTRVVTKGTLAGLEIDEMLPCVDRYAAKRHADWLNSKKVHKDHGGKTRWEAHNVSFQER